LFPPSSQPYHRVIDWFPSSVERAVLNALAK
jgi:hypothetical protein